MEGFPRDVQNMILGLVAGRYYVLLVPMLKTNRMFHTWVIRFIVDYCFSENVLSEYILKSLPQLDGNEVRNWGVCNALREQWKDKPSFLASFIIYIHTERLPFFSFPFLKVSHHVNRTKANQVFWKDNYIFLQLEDKASFKELAKEWKQKVERQKQQIELAEAKVRSLNIDLFFIESTQILYEKKIEMLESKMKKQKK